jgi:hypothetical protein
MTENLSFYPRLGCRETGRAEHSGFDRVFFTKRTRAGLRARARPAAVRSSRQEICLEHR